MFKINNRNTTRTRCEICSKLTYFTHFSGVFIVNFEKVTADWDTTTSLAETPKNVFILFAGVHQCGPESPPVYNLNMDFVMHVFNEECSRS